MACFCKSSFVYGSRLGLGDRRESLCPFFPHIPTQTLAGSQIGELLTGRTCAFEMVIGVRVYELTQTLAGFQIGELLTGPHVCF